MKRIFFILALVALALPVAAQDAEDFDMGTVNLGLWQRDTPSSSKFLEYRDIPQGAALNFFQFKGRKGDFNYDVFGYGVTQKDQRYYGIFQGSKWKLEGWHVGVPHNFGNGGRSILDPTGATDWRMSDTLQEAIQTQVGELPARNYNTVLPIVQPTLDSQPANIDLKLQRNRTNLAFSFFPESSSFDVGVTYLHERRTGTRSANGTAFGFNNVIETPEPLKYITQDFGLNATFRGDWGSAFAGFNLNDFANRYDTFGWDNPFRATDSTDGRAYLGPYTTVNGPKTGLMALPPSNQAWNVKAGTTLKFGRSTRLSANAQVGQWKQNEQPFIGWTTNTAVETPGPLPATHLDGKIDVLALNGYFTSKLTDALRLNARYRLYENENKTPRISFDGYVRFDAVWEDIPRISVPYGFKSNLFDTYLTYDLGRMVALEAGYKYNKIDRTFRESEHTTENMFRLAADVRFGAGILRGIYEFGDRDLDHYLPVEGEEHSFLDPGQPANNTALRRYDQQKRDRNRFGAQLQVSPSSGVVTLGASYFYNKEEYDNGPVSCNADFHDGDVGDSAETCVGGQTETLGLEEAKYTTFSLDADFSPSNNFTLYGFYTREDTMSLQDGIQSGGSLTFSPGSRWSSSIDNKVDSLGAGVRWSFVPDAWTLSLFYRYQKADGFNSFVSGENLRDPEDITDYDDTKHNFFAANMKWQLTDTWALGFGAFWEKYEFTDAQTQELLNYMPGTFLLLADNWSYDSWSGWVNMTYRFQ